MHHKRKRSKNARAGCLLCKPNKMVTVQHALEFQLVAGDTLSRA
jgi:hypothetical protein